MAEEWTIPTLKQYFDTIMREREVRDNQRFEAQQEAVAAALASAEKAVSAAMAATEKAVSKAEAAAEKRFDGVNEFRQTLTDQAASFMTRVEADAKMGNNAKDIVELKGKLEKIDGQTGGKNQSWLILVAAFGLIFGLVGVLSEVWTLLHH